ncbi:MAG TPA: endonuclease/exonuclease/phosphatase family protein [Pseudolabrys sp.]|nr:endonuclease/exonuclease/phosphatase family protein [Pseudolabrys sp.]
MRFSVLTLNLWNISEPLTPRMAALEAGLKALRPDIICLQEVAMHPGTSQRQSLFAARTCGLPHAVDNDQLSILSRFPIERWQSVTLPEVPDDEPRQALLADMLIDGRPLLVANTHLAWRLEWLAERKTQVDVLLAAIERHGPAEAMILCGDFNDDPDSPALRAVLARSLGFRDAYAVCRPTDPGMTWSRQNPYVHPSTMRDQRVDYIFSAGALSPRECSVVFAPPAGLASDHYGVFCKFEFRAP